MIFIIMGVSGSGKSTIGSLLAQQLNVKYIEADDYHPPKNIQKMANAIPLNDDDRMPWLIALREEAVANLSAKGAVISCSGLKQSYRDILTKDIEAKCQWIYLKGDYAQILERMRSRNHFMPETLLRSQFDTLEEPNEAIKVPIHLPPSEIVSIIVSHLEKRNMKKHWGLIGLGVMGKSLSLNFAEKGVSLALFNRHVDGLEENVAKEFIASDSLFEDSSGFDDLESFVADLASPRKIQLMVNAGKPVDMVIDQLIPLLSSGDIIIDGGNSHYRDTLKRSQLLTEYGIKYFGVGISGGEEGARKGPSIMPGGSPESYQDIAPMLERIAARDAAGGSCCTHIGPDGAGHFVKMVHNGIEYAEMQLIAEVCHIGLNVLGYSPAELSGAWESHITPATNSYLIEITLEILKKEEDGTPLIHKILDKAGNKGTGSWTTIAASEYGVSATMISSALFARYTSSYLEDRKRYDALYHLQATNENTSQSLAEVLSALHIARWINHHQGFALLYAASESHSWNLNLSEIARIWTNGCIIRSGMMKECQELLTNGHDLLAQSSVKSKLEKHYQDLKQLSISAIEKGTSVPCHLAALDYLHAMTRSRSSAYIIQAQRDYFGAHTYQRVNDPSGKHYHTNWMED